MRAGECLCFSERSAPKRRQTGGVEGVSPRLHLEKRSFFKIERGTFTLSRVGYENLFHPVVVDAISVVETMVFALPQRD